MAQSPRIGFTPRSGSVNEGATADADSAPADQSSFRGGLSRSIPFLLRWMVAPIINRESRSALLDMLQAMKTKLEVPASVPW